MHMRIQHAFMTLIFEIVGVSSVKHYQPFQRTLPTFLAVHYFPQPGPGSKKLLKQLLDPKGTIKLVFQQQPSKAHGKLHLKLKTVSTAACTMAWWGLFREQEF